MKLYKGGLLLSIMLATPATPAIAGQLRLEMSGGRVTLVAEDVTIGQILDEWARVGQTQVINGDRLSGSPVTLQLTSVPEKLALDVILRSTTGYIAALRRGENLGLSFYERILVLTTNTTGPPPQSIAAPLPSQESQFPTRVPGLVRLEPSDVEKVQEELEVVSQEEDDGAQATPLPFQTSDPAAKTPQPARGVSPGATPPVGAPAGTSRVPGMIAPASGSPSVPMPD